jgi:hypothetical protein
MAIQGLLTSARREVFRSALRKILNVLHDPASPLPRMRAE